MAEYDVSMWNRFTMWEKILPEKRGLKLVLINRLYALLLLKKFWLKNHAYNIPDFTVSAFDNVEIEIVANKDVWHTNRQNDMISKTTLFFLLCKIWKLYNNTTNFFPDKFGGMDRQTDNVITIGLPAFSCRGPN